MPFIDLKSKPLQSHTCASLRKEMANELRKDGVLSTDGLSVASAYTRRMRSGRTKPAVLLCEDMDGNNAGEFVVKLRAGIDSGFVGLTCELLSSLRKARDHKAPAAQ